jgi:hypothetical protein
MDVSVHTGTDFEKIGKASSVMYASKSHFWPKFHTGSRESFGMFLILFIYYGCFGDMKYWTAKNTRSIRMMLPKLKKSSLFLFGGVGASIESNKILSFFFLIIKITFGPQLRGE